jgi:hypothetical protein
MKAVRAWLRFQSVILVWWLALGLAGMTDQTLVNTLLKNLLCTTSAGTWNPTGGTSLTITPPLHLRLYTVAGSETASGTESTSGNCPGYTALGNTMGSPSFSSPSSGAASNANAVSWNATGSWSTIVAVEIWDTSGTPVRILWGTITNITGVANADTVQFAAAAVSASAATW